MPSTVQDFKSRARKIVTLPSGLSVEIRSLRLIDFLDLGELPLPSAGAQDKKDGRRSTLTAAEIRRLSSHAIVHGAVDPKFTASDEEEHSEHLVHMRDLTWDDFNALATEILEWSGLKKEVAADAESFRAYGVGENGPGAGEGIREAPNGNPGTHAGEILSESLDNVSPGSDTKEKT